MCPTSNVHTRAAPSLAEHPLDLLRKLRFRVTVSTDNRLMSGVTLSSELAAVSEAFDFGIDEIRWQEFDDPAGRPTQPVQILFDTDPYVLRTRFVPGFSAAEHWHDFDTLYLITAGRMRFGDEGWYETGDIRWVSGGQSYGPEEPGSEGVEFILISSGGPVLLHWADLEPPPKGKLIV